MPDRPGQAVRGDRQLTAGAGFPKCPNRRAILDSDFNPTDFTRCSPFFHHAELLGSMFATAGSRFSLRDKNRGYQKRSRGPHFVSQSASTAKPV
jgi:hypothetical protein